MSQYSQYKIKLFTLLSSSINKIFRINDDIEFNAIALEVFKLQYENNQVYKAYVNVHHSDIRKIKHFSEIPFLPIQFFKSHDVICDSSSISKTFLSSGTSLSKRSKHHVTDLNLYGSSFLNGFKKFYGDPKDWIILALLPSYLEQGDSSLIYMVDQLMKQSKNKESRYLNLSSTQTEITIEKLKTKKVLLIGVSYALLDLAEKKLPSLKKWTIMETGGMKGRRKEMVREELHYILKRQFNVKSIHSEYGMTELLSQAYSLKNGLFNCPNWMKVMVRDLEDPFNTIENESSGGLNIIDLANLYSCSFIETQDIGKKYKNGEFEILGRFDNSEIRGCNLLSIS